MILLAPTVERVPRLHDPSKLYTILTFFFQYNPVLQPYRARYFDPEQQIHSLLQWPTIVTSWFLFPFACSWCRRPLDLLAFQ
ncbi:hypothetical protein PCANC_11278 [Puccinia coronata f. sp. avenae]|uniref:Uncharacterized protein n=1 Tax=Puccinia coronata f. sp. avenae TaxID=200324 RepID=A0A2N5T689_9BASI|nr:hypothetical protein PCANC_11278 [Puccinia coronata f. sp. avenae]